MSFHLVLLTHLDISFVGTNGFVDLCGHFEGAGIHIPLDPNAAEFNLHQGSSPTFPWQHIATYKRFEEAINTLPTPLVISCKSARRASAVLAAFKGVTQKLTKEEVHAIAKSNEWKYIGADGLTKWIDEVIDHFAKFNGLIFRQFFEGSSSTYTYLLADAVTKEAVLIDPVLETVNRDNQFVHDLGLNLVYGLNTHVHADHITGTGELRKLNPQMKSALGAKNKKSNARADVFLEDLEYVQFGSYRLYALSTPGHTEGCVSYVLNDLSRVFTGDTLLIRGCGRTDFQGGSADQLFHSVHDKIFASLPNRTSVFPAHDYKGNQESSVFEEKTFNPRLTKSKDQFIDIMNNLNLPAPKKINEAVPANLLCGVFDNEHK